ncbi:MAG: ATPase [Candidatus Binatia bacterium]|nr:MAG: ATPase [Candidatus Binatia bacterium]
MMEQSRAVRSLRDAFESGRPLVYIHSAEEHRIERLLQVVAEQCFEPRIPIFAWTLTTGLRDAEGREAAPGSENPRQVLDFIAAYPEGGIFHLKDFHEPLREDATVRRRLRDLYELCFDKAKFIVITSAVQFIPDELSRAVLLLELGLPDAEELQALLRSETTSLRELGHPIELDEEYLLPLARALQGLTVDEARHAIRRALAHHKKLGPEAIPALLEEKRLVVNRTGLVQYVADGTTLEHVGGLEVMKRWLIERRKLFQMRDQLSADIVPKGVLIMGISGCGKSLSVKAIASTFELPLYRIDMTEIFSGKHGPPESAFAEACKILEQISPAVCWFDELEMAVTSSESAGEQGRMFAFFLTWMQEKTRGLFVAATANRIDLLPAEMIRKGRFDEVFFVDLPTDEERVEIFRIHLQRRGVDPSQFDLERLKRFTKGWTGAECEQCVVSALTTARIEERDLTDDDLLNATATIVPLSKTMKEQVDHIREWAFERAVRASPRELTR